MCTNLLSVGSSLPLSLSSLSLSLSFFQTMDDKADATADDVSKYSVLVGFVLIVVFVVPCVMFALLAKYFQSPDRIRRGVS